MAGFHITLEHDIVKGYFLSQTPEALISFKESFLSHFLEAQATEATGAARIAPVTVTAPESVHPRPGSEPLLWISPSLKWQFSHEFFARYKHSTQALVLVLMEMVLQGISTRKMTQITEELCGTSFSKTNVSAPCKEITSAYRPFEGGV